MRFLTFQPLIPPALWALLCLACAASWIWYAARRPSHVSHPRWYAILALSACGVAAVLAILLNPTWLVRVAPPGGKPLLNLLVDASASMDTPDSGAGTTRFEAAGTIARELAGSLSDQFEVRTSVFASSTKRVDPAALTGVRPDGPITDLAAAISSSLVEDRPAGQSVVLLSDGIHNAGGRAERVLEAVRRARGLAAPVYTKTFGGEIEVHDLSLALESPQELSFIGQKAPLVAQVRRRGLGAPQGVVVLSQDERELERRPITFDAQGRAQARFDVGKEKPGLYRYHARVEPAPGEVILVNNDESFLLRVVDEPIRILLLEGKPYWDAKFLIRTLGSDPSIELDSVVRLAQGRFLRRTLTRPRPSGGAGGSAPEAPKAAPGSGAARVDDWKILTGPEEVLSGKDGLTRYQIVVLGRDADVFLGEGPLARLREWIVKDGGALVCYRGAPAAQLAQPLARLLPVRWSRSRESRFHVQLTARGRELRWIPPGESGQPGDELAGLPTLARSEQPHEPKPLAVVLATSTPASTSGADGGQTPVVTFQPYGSGRTVVIEGAGMWRWAFLPPEQRDQTGLYGSLWHSLIRWLASGAGLPPGRSRALRADKIVFDTNEPASATLLLRRDSSAAELPRIDLEGDALPSRKQFTPVASADEPGTFRVLFGPLLEGRYRARIVARDNSAAAPTDEIAFDVRGFAEEQLDRAARPDLMARIAAESGGAVLASGSSRELINGLEAARARSQTEQVLRYPAWDRWWLLLSIVAAWGTAWMLRRSAGLV
jgi:hypothetical protein